MKMMITLLSPRYLSLLILSILPLTIRPVNAAESCPAGATGITLPQFTIFLRGSSTGVAGETIAGCNQLELQAALVYRADCPDGLTCVAFSDGILSITDVTNHRATGLYSTNALGGIGRPSIPLIGPSTDPANCPGAISGIVSDRMLYTITPENMAAGRVTFRVQYDDCTLWLNGFQSNSASGSFETFVNIAAPPSCRVALFNSVFPGELASLTATPLGSPPFTFAWTGPNGFTAGNTNTIIINNVQPANTGVYTATVTDKFGCSASASSTLTLIPRFTSVKRTGLNLIMTGSGGPTNGTYTVLTTTDASTPMTLWVPLVTNSFDGEGEFSFTNRITINEPQKYFRLLLR